ncbi:hypothetical protein DRO38_03455 [Candidatus Bathyarchaeota archaeon]|nr:MAG: hypothetical protein DRO38_03455 [Candidatus Bathyarchaeota archaeon]
MVDADDIWDSVCCTGPMWWILLYLSIIELFQGIDKALAGILSVVGVIAGFIVLGLWADADIDHDGAKNFILIVLFIVILGYFINICISSGGFILAVILPTITVFIIFGGTIMLIWDYLEYLDFTEGETFIKFGIAWFISIFLLSLIIDLSLMGYRDRGVALFFLSLFLNLPGTCILLGIGAKKLKSDADRYPYLVRGHAKNIIYFGIFWFIFWFISSIIIGSNTIDPGGCFFVFLLFITIPGTVTIITFGRRLSKVIGEGLEIYGPTPSTGGYSPVSISNINDIPEHAVCPYCQENIRESFYEYGGVVKCPKCGTFHHADCFRQGGCGNPACRFRKS